MRQVADALGVSCSQVHKRIHSGPKTNAVELLKPVRCLVVESPTRGYRRVGALLNRERLQAGLPRHNYKRVHRLMALNRLLLRRYMRKSPARAHDDKIITIRPNRHWTYDGFEIECRNGEVARVVFGLDTCDGEVMAGCVSTGGRCGEMIRELMMETTKRRLGTSHTSQPAQWVSDNDGTYRAYETAEFSARLGLVPSFTPVRSAESNGIAEALVRIFKRD